MKKRLPTIVLIAVFCAGICILLYPTVSDWWNSRVQSRAIENYEAALSELTQNDYSAIFAEADKYNAAVRELDFPLMEYKKLDEREDFLPYDKILDASGDGMMGYVEIESIDVKLPVYHGTSTSVLNVAVGHLEGTSLPVGGASTHSVLSAHRGLPSARLFTDLTDLAVGDMFRLFVFDRALTYEVFDISIVEPNEVDSLYVREGEDLCTLFTCTPYGINSHRLLVTGRRIEDGGTRAALYVPADGVLIDALVVAPILGALILAIMLAVLMIRTRKRS